MPKDTAALGELLVVESLNRIDSKIDKLDDRLDGMSVTLTKQQGSLDEHVRRTNLLEDKIDAETKAIKDGLDKAAAEAVKAERNKLLITALKVLGVASATGGAGFGLKEVIGWFIKVWTP